MKKVANQTARVLWQRGQPLLPEHFQAQEQALREEASLRFACGSRPGYGVGSLEVDPMQLKKGIVSVSELTLVMPSGTLVDIPGNAPAAFVNVNAAGSRASVYVHLLAGHEPVRAGGRDEGVTRAQQRVELSTNPFSDRAVQSFKLLELDGAADGSWSMSPAYIAPALLVGGSPLFDDVMKRLEGLVRALRQVLVGEVQENFLSAQGSASGRMALRGLWALQAMLVDLVGGVRLHPYELFSALRSFYIDLCVHREITPVEVERPYRHDELAACFGALLDRLEEQASLQRGSIPYTEFTRRDGLLVCELDREARRARQVFLLVQKPQVTAKVDLSRTKLAAPSRIHAVYERSLRGIRYQPLDNPPFAHGLAATVEFYQIEPGPEWDHAVRDGQIVFFDDPSLQGVRFHMYWRPD